ncbi:MAG: hydroxysqualene dehydroxylase HpnE [Alphaproteobacteria bacterium]|nr:hydroxysqualene dehydroxylase HpnE [Alphaproteobacteria bacterium]
MNQDPSPGAAPAVGTLHIVGAGLAGLAAAVRASTRHSRIILHEAANHAGGRCRSYLDRELGVRIDNGNHLMLTANRAALDYLRETGALETMLVPAEPAFPFFDRRSGERWTLRPNRGRLPWWVLFPERRVPGTRLADYLHPFKLARLDAKATVQQAFERTNLLYQRLWLPFAVAALNTEPERASARLLWNVIRESFAEGGEALLPMVPREGLSESLVDPALATLALRGVVVRFNARLRRIEAAGERITALDFTDGRVTIEPDDQVILALPAQIAGDLGLEIATPDEFRAIVNGHFLFEHQMAPPGILGVIGGLAEWIFVKPQVISTTTSAADRVVDWGAEELAHELWGDVQMALGLQGIAMPNWRIVKEKRATFAATPEAERRRSGTLTRWRNLFLAGDWTCIGLPSTIEGAIRSGQRAASVIAGRRETDNLYETT